MPHLELNLAPTAEDMPDMALELIRAIIAAADQDRDEMTVLLVHGEPVAVIAPYGHERRPGASAEIRFDQTAPAEARLVLTDTWGGSIRMSIEEFRQLAREGVSSRFDAMAQIAESWS
jgi:antitoxin (DNA-binding transcriptional repressor) of toxin-antitoxin stability system